MSTSCSRPEATRTTGSVGRRVAVIGSNRQLDSLAPLRHAYRARGIDELAVLANDLLTPEALGELAGDVDAVLLAYPRHRAPSTVVPWPTVAAARERRIAVGLVPDHGDSLARFAVAAAAVHERAGDPATTASIALLAQRSRRYLDLAGRIRRLLLAGGRAPAAMFWWPADEIVRDDVTIGLRYGLAVAWYVGHGRPSGWVGYAGIRAHHLADADAPSGVVVSLACQTLSRRHIALSFGERLVAQGSAAATIGSVSATRHVANARWSLRLVDAVSNGVRTAGDLLVAAEPDVAVARTYRLVGDPMAPLLDAPGARAAAQRLTDDVVFPSPSHHEPREISA
jgi:hypothetical protein